MGKTCVICGKAGYKFYPFCYEHLQMKSNGEIEKCESCGEWHFADKPCKKCDGGNIEKESKNIDCFLDLDDDNAKKKDNETHERIIGKNCLICGAASNGYLFCRTHYNKYKNKALLVKITKCSEIEILDESYEGIYICRDGHVVKSKSEREIDNYLFSNKIAHAYEKALIIDGETFHPDFYLPELKVYIEHWGYDESNYEYTRRKDYKIKKYQQKGITLICTHEKTDTKDIETALDRKLDDYKEGQINYLDENE